MDGVLREAEVLEGGARGDLKLRLDNVHAGHLLGDGVLHLDARVDLDEKVLVPADEELDGTSTAVADGLGDLDGVGEEFVADLLVEVDGGGDLDDLLIAPLHGAVTLVQVDDVDAVGDDLHLHVTRLDQVALDEDVAGPEGRLRLGLGGHESLLELVHVVADAHALPSEAEAREACALARGRGGGEEEGGKGAPPCATAHLAAAAHGGLDHEREASRLGEGHGCVHVGDGVAPGDDGQAGVDGDGPGGGLGPKLCERLGRGADENDAIVFARLRKVGVLRQEAVAGVDGLGAGLLGGLDDAVDSEVRADGRQVTAGGVEEDGLVTGSAVLGVLVLLGVDRHRLSPQLVDGPRDARGNLAAVCHEHAVKHVGRRVLDHSHSRDARAGNGETYPRSDETTSVRGGEEGEQEQCHGQQQRHGRAHAAWAALTVRRQATCVNREMAASLGQMTPFPPLILSPTGRSGLGTRPTCTWRPGPCSPYAS